MPLGQQLGTLKNLKRSLKKGTMGPITYIPKNGSLTVRFLEEPEMWFNFQEHYDTTLRRSYPCTGEGDCPGCLEDLRKSSRYLANALDVEKDRVIAVQLPKELTTSLVKKYERNDTIMDRDYILSRDGEGLDTTYDAEGEPVLKRRLTKYEPLDLLTILEQVYTDTFGGDEDEEAASKNGAPKKATAKRVPSKASARLKGQVEDADEEDEDEEDDEPEPAPKAKKKFSPPARPVDEDDEDEDEDEEDEDEDEDEEDEDEDEADDEEEDEEAEEVISEEELEAMSIGKLRLLAKDYDIDTKGMKKADIIEALLESEED